MILSLDVGFKNTGCVVFDVNDNIIDCGVITTEKSKKRNVRTADDYSLRASQLASGLKNVIESYDIKAVVGELPTGGAQSAKAMVQMGMANAVVSSVCTILDIPTDWATPNEVKLTLCGNRSATKEELMKVVKNLYPNADFPKQKGLFEHIADAVGAYLSIKDVSPIIKIVKQQSYLK